MKILGVLGSPRIGGNSDILLDRALDGAKEAGAEVEKIVLRRMKISGCLDCTKCNEAGVCAIKDDMQDLYPKILEADAILHSVPVYFWAMTAQMKAYLDRWCAFFDGEWKWHKHYYPKIKGKKIGLITVCGDSNVHTADPIVHSFKTTVDFTKLRWIGSVMASAAAKGEVAKERGARSGAQKPRGLAFRSSILF
jgi:multimeric flavodoxin WrbA